MRYWQHGETGRLLAIDLQMASIHWIEITKEQYEERLNETGDCPAGTDWVSQLEELHPPTGGSNVQKPSDYS